MTLQQALTFLNQSSQQINNARSRLDKACESLASFISEKGLPGERVNVNGRTYEITEKCSSIGCYRFLGINEEDEYSSCIKSLQDNTDYYLHGNFDIQIDASSRQDKFEFATHAKEVIEAFTKLWQDKSEKFNNAAMNIEQIVLNSWIVYVLNNDIWNRQKKYDTQALAEQAAEKLKESGYTVKIEVE